MRIHSIGATVGASRALRNQETEPTLASLRPSKILEALHQYFRVELRGANDVMPEWPSGPCIFIMNHTALIGLEVYLFHSILERLRPTAPRVRTTVWAPFLGVPGLGRWYRAGGCLAMSVEGVAERLRQGESVLVLPEGPDATDIRDEVGPFHAGFLRAIVALGDEAEVPVVPLGWSGVDEAIPWFVTTQPLLVKLLMKPFMPAFGFALFPRLPILRPSKVVFVAGPPLLLQAKELGSEERLQGELQRSRSAVLGLVKQARALRTERIESSGLERALHSVFRMHRVLWERH